MTFIIAEAGSNWRMGSPARDLAMAHALIDVAAEAGADAVKFQVYRAETVYAAGAGHCDHLLEKGLKQEIREIFRELEMAYEMIPKLAAYCQERGIALMASVFSRQDFAAVDPYVAHHKIASPELHHPKLIELCAHSGKPTYLSTGMSTEEEIAWAIDLYHDCGGRDLALMQCTVAYPTPPDSVSLAVLPTLAARFGLPVGLSDHTLHPVVAPVGAVALGATSIEKHYTISRRLVGPDHSWALEPEELSEMVCAVRLAEQMRGSNEKRVQPAEESLLFFSKRGLHATQKIGEGESLKLGHNLAILRSGQQKQGLHARYLKEIEGCQAARAIAAGEGLELGDWV